MRHLTSILFTLFLAFSVPAQSCSGDFTSTQGATVGGQQCFLVPRGLPKVVLFSIYVVAPVTLPGVGGSFQLGPDTLFEVPTSPVSPTCAEGCLAIPNDPSLAGVFVFFQFIEFTPGFTSIVRFSSPFNVVIQP